MKALTHHALLLLVALVCLSACKSKKEKLSDNPLARPEDEQELAYIPTFSKGVVAGWPRGRALDEHDTSRVRLGEEVHAYHLGRLPSRDRREMHEAHTVYRVEQDARWDTRLPATPMSSRGVALGIVEPSRAAVPDDAVVEQERQRLVAMSGNLQKKMAELGQIQEQLQKKQMAFVESEKDSIAIQQRLGEIIGERDKLTEDMKNAKARIQTLEEQQRLAEISAQQNFGGSKKK
ncbi:MAG: hypothetical protein ABL974_15615 [Prosthecobacter sp.]